MGYSPLIYAFEQDNIAITGEGILEGGGSNQPVVAVERQMETYTLAA